LPLARNVAQAAQIRLGNEGGAQQPRACQRGQPLRIGHIGLARSGTTFKLSSNVA